MESTAAVLRTTADPEALAAEAPAEIETIEVAEPQAAEVLVEVVASSLCHTDVSMATGANEEPLPLVMGHEGAGVVREVGEGVTALEPGDHVVLGRIACGKCEQCRRGKSNLCTARRTYQDRGTLRTGGIRFERDGQPLHHCHGVSSFTEYTVVTDEVAIPITDAIPLEEATLLGCGVFTGAGAVMNTADIDPGSSVVVFGLGGVGLSGVQAADLRGAVDVIGVDPVPEKLDIARRLGATHVVNPDEVDAVERVREITGGGADYAFDMVGHPGVTEQCIEASAIDGAAVVVGGSPAGTHDVEIDLLTLTLREKTVLGSFNGSYNLSLAIPKLAEYVARGDLSLTEMVTSTRTLDDLNDAMADMEGGTAQIRQVITL